MTPLHPATIRTDVSQVIIQRRMTPTNDNDSILGTVPETEPLGSPAAAENSPAAVLPDVPEPAPSAPATSTDDNPQSTLTDMDPSQAIATSAMDDVNAPLDHVTFWRSQLAVADPLVPLSLGGPRTPPGLVPAPTLRTVPLPAAAGLSTSAVAVAAAATVAKFKRSSDAVVGIAVAGTDPATCTIVPVRIVLDDSTTVSDAVAAAAESIRAATEHSPVDLAQLRAWCGLSPSDPVCDVVLCIGKASNASLEADLASTGTAIALAVDTSADGGSVTSIHDGRMLDNGQAASIVDEFAFTVGHLVSALADQDTVESLWTLSPAQQAMIARFSHGERVPLPFSLAHHGFEARAKQHPDWRAVEHGDAHLSYGDLDACGCALAASLASHGVQRGSRVAVVMQRSIEFVVALVGVLKAGATIVPVDSSFPADRIQFMLDDASVRAIVTTASEADRIAQLSVGDRAVVVADARALLASGVSFTPQAQHTATGDDDAFIVYTSGSTGRPKGVLMPHKGASNTFNIGRKVFGFHEQRRVAQFMAIGFDACQCEIWTALTNGSTLVLREEDAFKTLSSVNATIITPTGLSQLGDPSQYAQMHTVTIVGEACPKELKDLWSRH
ncbi:hypothetical protein HK105_208165 [Polyrhizophydium stewartii]|uniref:AMP-dependent synthetase/ligase domain-containing protein n=1 Tax=Polyrhizophydium stewartii TaxID=2732419 RepID=A0ABR4MYM3_9FUNG